MLTIETLKLSPLKMYELPKSLSLTMRMNLWLT